MKGLVKILAPLVMAGTLFAANPTFAQEKEFSASTSFGFFRGNDKKIRDVYNEILSPKVKASFDYNFSRHFRLEGDFSSCIGIFGEPYVNNTKDITQLEGTFSSLEIPYAPEDITIKDKWSIMSFAQLAGIAEHLIPISKKDFAPNFYIGAGPTILTYYEKIIMVFKEVNNSKYNKIVKKESYKSAIGLTGVIGFELPLVRIDDYSFLSYIQLSGSYANVKGDLGKVNIGGLSLEAGIKFGLKEFQK